MTTGCYMLIIILLIQFQSWPVLGKTGVLWLWASDKQWKFWGLSFHSLDKMRPSDFEPYSIWLSKRGMLPKPKSPIILILHTALLLLSSTLPNIVLSYGAQMGEDLTKFRKDFQVLEDVLPSCTRTVKPRQRGSFHKSPNEKGWWRDELTG